ncbi:thiamine-phosphate kinase [Sphingomonas daechungensis]|uniref:Thiamine-monophosphate kinase n=1 Tax=Sphingomonas daechungensis TaxID=1176646 RepID=A0ABX6T3Y6_9SPHN|nr:thiamine-phosphate kinase [Sphingomonas daechungensis]QNP44244.1 thiamine-phosphate kinase [Sphingomonas daechungensis]
MREAQAIQRLRRIATSPAALGLKDDTAVLDGLVLTHDSIAEGVHFLSTDTAASVGWKLVAVNLSDLAGKGATPAGALLSLALSGDDAWDMSFLDGVEAACESYGLPLLGGDTIALPPGAPRVFGLTAIGRAGERVPLRSGGKAGDVLWAIGTLGDSAAGLELLRLDPASTGPLVDVYRRPVPLIALGQALAPLANAMMDVSDGLLLDAMRMAEASGLSAEIDIDAIPLSRAFIAERSGDLTARLFAATGGDDYALLAAIPADIDPLRLSLPSGTTIARIGCLVAEGPRLALSSGESPVPLPEHLGHEHRSNSSAPMADRS